VSEIFDKAVKEGLASLGKIPSPFEVGRKLGLNIPTMKDITGEDIKNILSIIGPQADIKAMVEESSRVVPALKKGDIPEALSGLVLSALAPLMIGSPGTVSGIRKGSEGLASLGETRKIKAKPEQKQLDLFPAVAESRPKRRIIDIETPHTPPNSKSRYHTTELMFNPSPNDVRRMLRKSQKSLEGLPGERDITYDVPTLKYHIDPNTKELAIWDGTQAHHPDVRVQANLWNKGKPNEYGTMANEGHIQLLPPSALHPSGKVVTVSNEGWTGVGSFDKHVKHNKFSKMVEDQVTRKRIKSKSSGGLVGLI